MFGSLSVSKGLATICEVSILVLSLDKIFTLPLRKFIVQYKNLFVFLPFLLLLIVGLLWTSNVPNGLNIVKHHHRWLAIPLLLAVNFDLLKVHYKRLLTCTVSIAGLASCITILFQFMPQDQVIWISENIPLIQEYPESGNKAQFGLYSPFVDRLQFSNLIGLSGISTLFLVVNRYAKKGLLLLLLPIFYCSLILGGRGGQLALLAGMFTYATILLFKYVLPRLAMRTGPVLAKLILVGIIVLGTVGIPSLLLNYSQSVNARYKQMAWELKAFENGTYEQYDYVHFTSVRRLVSWQHLATIFQEHYLFGAGTGDVKDELKLKYDQDNYIFPVNIHSQYLYILAGWGITGFLIFFGGWAYWLAQLRKNSGIFIFGVVFTVFSLTSMTTDAIFIKQVDLMAFAVYITFVGLLPIIEFQKETENQSQDQPIVHS